MQCRVDRDKRSRDLEPRGLNVCTMIYARTSLEVYTHPSQSLTSNTRRLGLFLKPIFIYVYCVYVANCKKI